MRDCKRSTLGTVSVPRTLPSHPDIREIVLIDEDVVMGWTAGTKSSPVT